MPLESNDAIILKISNPIFIRYPGIYYRQMSDQLAQFRQDGDRASDDDQRTVVLSLSAGPRNEGHCAECLVPANIYSKALAKLLACLRSLTPTKSLTDEIARTIEFKEILARDISHGYQP